MIFVSLAIRMDALLSNFTEFIHAIYNQSKNIYIEDLQQMQTRPCLPKGQYIRYANRESTFSKKYFIPIICILLDLLYR